MRSIHLPPVTPANAAITPLAVSPDTYATDAVQSPQRAKYTLYMPCDQCHDKTQKKGAKCNPIKADSFTAFTNHLPRGGKLKAKFKRLKA